MVDPLTSLAFSLYSGKGVYALLVGSGVSRAAEIPTGWEVTLDLTRKLAKVEGEDCNPDPEIWYRKRYHSELDYSVLLEALAPTPSERTNLLSSYFEATPEDRDVGRKTPTLAHRAIARLVSKGYLKVILTTNFDRLMEQALESEGVNPTIISTTDMVLGAMPLAHAQCTVIKVHGDYRDTRLRNTSSELVSYPTEINTLLDRVFDEYGLIVCGWSATWDRALCDAIFRNTNRRFTVFWGSRGQPSAEATRIIKFRQASTFEIDSANGFFSLLEKKVESLEMFNKPHPLSTPMALASLKRYLTEERFRIELRELLSDESERQVKSLAPLGVQLPSMNNELAVRECLARMQLYESSMEMLISLIAHGCFYGTPEQAKIWMEAILRMAGLSVPRGGSTVLINLLRYPACLLMYAGGIASVASCNYATLRTLLREGRTSRSIAVGTEDRELIFALVPGRVVDSAILENRRAGFGTPVSNHLHKLLRDPIRPLIPEDNEYDDLFDRFEYLFTLVHFDIEWSKRGEPPKWAPVGRFVWRGGGFGSAGPDVSQQADIENETQQEKWPPIQSGLFASTAGFRQLSDTYRQSILSKIDAW